VTELKKKKIATKKKKKKATKSNKKEVNRCVLSLLGKKQVTWRLGKDRE